MAGLQASCVKAFRGKASLAGTHLRAYLAPERAPAKERGSAHAAKDQVDRSR